MSRGGKKSETRAPEQLSLFGDEESTPTKTPAAGPVSAKASAPPQRARSAPPQSAPLTTKSSAVDGKSPAVDVREAGREMIGKLARWLPEPPASVTLTRNRTRIVSARPDDGGGLRIRIHRCFVGADDGVLRSVALLLDRPDPATRKAALAVIREHFRRHGETDTHKPRNLRPQGQYFDLESIRDRINAQYFNGALELAISWGQAGKGRRRRRHAGFSIRLGSYDDKLKLVRIHPVLDRPDVPEYVIESIVHHEMVHAVVPVTHGANRRSIHPPEFRRLERLSPFTNRRRPSSTPITEVLLAED